MDLGRHDELLEALSGACVLGSGGPAGDVGGVMADVREGAGSREPYGLSEESDPIVGVHAPGDRAGGRQRVRGPLQRTPTAALAPVGRAVLRVGENACGGRGRMHELTRGFRDARGSTVVSERRVGVGCWLEQVILFREFVGKFAGWGVTLGSPGGRSRPTVSWSVRGGHGGLNEELRERVKGRLGGWRARGSSSSGRRCLSRPGGR